MKSQAINPDNVYKICGVFKLLREIYSQKIRQKEDLLFLALQFDSPNEMWGEGHSRCTKGSGLSRVMSRVQSKEELRE